MRGGAFGREEGSPPLAESDAVAAALGKAGEVGVGRADARLLPGVARAAAAVLRVEGGSEAAVQEELRSGTLSARPFAGWPGAGAASQARSVSGR